MYIYAICCKHPIVENEELYYHLIKSYSIYKISHNTILIKSEGKSSAKEIFEELQYYTDKSILILKITNNKKSDYEFFYGIYNSELWEWMECV